MTTSQHPTAITLPDDLQARLDSIVASSRARFGHGQWFMEDDGDSSSDTGDDSSTDDSTDSGADDNGDSSGDDAAADDADWAKGWDGKVESLPTRVQKLLKDARDEAAKNRTGKNAAEEQQQKILKAVAAAAGLKIDDDNEPNPDELAKQLADSQTAAREAAVQLEVYKTASKHKGDPDALLDSRAFLAKVKDLDPTADNFAETVDAAIKDAVKDNPKLQATQAATSSSADHAGGSGGGGGKPKNLEDAISARMGG